MIDIEIQNPNGFETLPKAIDLQKWSEAALQDNSQDCSVVLRFVDMQESSHLNSTYRHKEAATNVLSFSYDSAEIIPEKFQELIPEPMHLGDLVLCEPLVKQEAQAQNKALKQHWVHLITHGLLHLQGYDHIDENDAIIMEALEIKILDEQGFANPYLEVIDS